MAMSGRFHQDTPWAPALVDGAWAWGGGWGSGAMASKINGHARKN
jgi:hypothetical protein